MAFLVFSFAGSFCFALATMRRHDRFVSEVIRRRSVSGREVYSVLALLVCVLLLRRVWHPGASALPYLWTAVLLFTLWGVTFFRASAPILCIASGVVSNLLVVASNGFTMPADGLMGISPDHVLLGASSRLWYLGDIFSFSAGRWVGGYSIGDCAIAAGFWWLNARLWMKLH